MKPGRQRKVEAWVEPTPTPTPTPTPLTFRLGGLDCHQQLRSSKLFSLHHGIAYLIMVFGWRPLHHFISGGPWHSSLSWKGPFAVIQLYFCQHLFATHVGWYQGTEGPSMLPTLNVRGDYVWINRSYQRGQGVEVGDIVSFKHPTFPGVSASKRVIGMPGDYVMRHSPDSENDMMIQVPEGHCFVAGDNVPYSRDSRDYGPIPLALIKGKVTWRVWPWSQIQRMENTMEPIERDAGFMKNG